MRSSSIGSLVFCLLFPAAVIGQSGMVPGMTNQGSFTGGLGISVIDDTTYATFTFMPELAIGKFGIGLYIPLRFNLSSGGLRGDDWNEPYDYLRIVRYARYGYKSDPFYTRAGMLDATRIGHGFIMNFYNNGTINFDKRKIGLELDVDAGLLGVESMTSNLGRAEIFGARGYVRPLYGTNLPILRHFAVGASYVTDIDPDQNRNTPDEVAIYGADVELPIIKTSFFRTSIYADWAQIRDYGSGKSLGIEMRFRKIGNVLNLVAQVERRYLGKEFLPGYFNAFYELDRFRIENGVEFRKEALLGAIQQETRGTFGLLYGSILRILELGGTYESYDAVPNSGLLQLKANLARVIPSFRLRASYQRSNISGASDLFRLDDRSIARLGVGYNINAFMVAYLDYIYTFKYDENIGEYRVQKRFEPQIVFVYPFQF